MSEFRFFTVEQYGTVTVLTLAKAAATHVLQNGELRAEMQAFVATAKPLSVVVNFSQLTRCPSAIISSLIGLRSRMNDRGSRLALCGMNQSLRDQFARLHLDSVFVIHDALSEAIAACEIPS